MSYQELPPYPDSFYVSVHSYRVAFEGKLIKAFAMSKHEHQRTTAGFKADLRKILDEAVLTAERDWKERSKDEAL